MCQHVQKKKTIKVNKLLIDASEPIVVRLQVYIYPTINSNPLQVPSFSML